MEGPRSRWGFTAVASTMAIGGLLNARKVAETMSRKITTMNHARVHGKPDNRNPRRVASLYGLPVFDHARVGRFAFRHWPDDRKSKCRHDECDCASMARDLASAAIASGAIYWALKTLPCF